MGTGLGKINQSERRGISSVLWTWFLALKSELRKIPTFTHSIPPSDTLLLLLMLVLLLLLLLEHVAEGVELSKAERDEGEHQEREEQIEGRS